VASTTKKILIKVDVGDSKGALDAISKKFGMLNKNVKSLSGSMSFLSNSLKGFVAFLGVRELTRMSDEMQNLSNRLNITTNSGEDAARALQGIGEIAERTNQSIADTGVVFNRMSQSLKSVGASTQEVLAITEALTNTFRISGTNTAETTNGIIQLSQAFNKGKLDGDEFRSVMEQNVVIAQALKEKFGQDIYKKASEGAIKTKDVIQFLSDSVGKLSVQASKLAPTFEQTLTKSLGKVSLVVKDLNEEFKLSSKFATVMGIAVNNLGTILTIAGAVSIVYFISQIENMRKALVAARIALIALATANPILLALTGVATVGALVWENWDKGLKKVRATFLEITAFMEDLNRRFYKGVLGGAGKDLDKFASERIAQLRKEAKELREGPSYSGAGLAPYDDSVSRNRRALEDLFKKMPDGVEKTKSLKGELSELNKQFLLDGDIAKYNQKLEEFKLKKFTTQFSEGREDIFKFHEQIRDFDLAMLNKALKDGTINLREFQEGSAAVRLSVLNEQVNAGVISLAKYNEEVNKLEDKVRPGSAFYSGVNDFVESAGTLAQGIAKVTTQAFGHLEDTLFEFTKTGKFNFASFTAAIIDDINRMLIRAAIVAPIAQGILSFAGGAFGGGGGGGLSTGGPGMVPTVSSANGNVMTPSGPAKLNMYANGGIAKSPQVSLFGEGRQPEAYVPLPDGRTIPVTMEGSGGFSFTQTIIIQDGAATEKGSGSGSKAKEFGALMKQIATDTIIQQQKPGGLLA